MSNRWVRLYHLGTDETSTRRCRELQAALTMAETQCLDAATCELLWRASGLRTVPAAEVFEGSESLAQFDGSIELGPILEILANKTSVTPLTVVDPIDVVSSSGSYRYGRWSESFVLDSQNPDLGWSSQSATTEHKPWLVFDCLRQWNLAAIDLTPRDYNKNPDFTNCFPESFAIDVKIDDEWETVLEADKASTTLCNQLPRQWTFSTEARFVRFRVTQMNKRSNGRYVCQLAGIRLWGRPGDVAGTVGLSRGRWDDTDSQSAPTAIRKAGLFWSDSDTVVTSWNIDANVSLPPRALLSGNAKFFVLEGRIEVRMGDNAPIELKSGEWFGQWPGTPVTITATATAILFEVRSQADSAEAWCPVT